MHGGTLSRLSPNVVAVNPYSCSDATREVWLETTSQLAKDLSAPWQAGNAGAMGIGQVLAPNTWYHVFAMQYSATGFDVFVDTNVGGGNAPAGTLARRRIGAILTNASNAIINFQQNNDLFTWIPGTDSINIISQQLSTSAPQATQFLCKMTPLGVQTVALLNGNLNIITATGAQNFQAVFYPTFMGSLTTASFGGFITVETVGQGGIAAFDTQVIVDASQLIGLGWAATAATTQIHLNCRGYIDTRGKM